MRATGVSAIGNPYLFTARRLDEEAGLLHYRARAYDVKRGRFLQRDPAREYDGINLYSYAKENPANWVDPLGLWRTPVNPFKAAANRDTYEECVAAIKAKTRRIKAQMREEEKEDVAGSLRKWFREDNNDAICEIYSVSLADLMEALMTGGLSALYKAIMVGEHLERSLKPILDERRVLWKKRRLALMAEKDKAIARCKERFGVR